MKEEELSMRCYETILLITAVQGIKKPEQFRPHLNNQLKVQILLLNVMSLMYEPSG